MVTDNPLIESCLSRTPPRPEILWHWLEIGWGRPGGLGWAGVDWSWLGAGWKLAGSWLEAGWAESNRYEEPRVSRASFDCSRRLGPAGGTPGLACGRSGGDTRGNPEWGDTGN